MEPALVGGRGMSCRLRQTFFPTVAQSVCFLTLAYYITSLSLAFLICKVLIILPVFFLTIRGNICIEARSVCFTLFQCVRSETAFQLRTHWLKEKPVSRRKDPATRWQVNMISQCFPKDNCYHLHWYTVGGKHIVTSGLLDLGHGWRRYLGTKASSGQPC